MWLTLIIVNTLDNQVTGKDWVEIDRNEMERYVDCNCRTAGQRTRIDNVAGRYNEAQWLVFPLRKVFIQSLHSVHFNW